MKENHIKNSQKYFVQFTLVVIVLLTSMLSLIIYLTFINNETSLILRIYDLFARHKWAIFLIGLFILIGLILCIIFLSMQAELFFSNRIRKMYSELESETVKGLDRLPIGVINYDRNYQIVWSNQFFRNETKEDIIGENIYEILPQLEMDDEQLESNKEAKQFFFSDVAFDSRVVDIYQDLDAKILYLFDKTQEHDLLVKNEQEKIVVGYIYIDAPDEIQVVEDSSNLDISGEIHRAIVSWADEYDVYVRKYSSYRWMLVTNQGTLDMMVADGMDVRKYVNTIANEMETTISISGGFAVYEHSMADTVKEAVSAIELGQSRGGDQLIVRFDDSSQKIFGGDTFQKKRTSRVMVRSTALSLHNEIQKHDAIYISAHAMADLDAIGSMLGIAEIVKSLEKEVYFIIDMNRLADGVEELFERVWREDEIEESISKMVVSPGKLKLNDIGENDLLIISDVSTPALFENEHLAEVANIIVLDHHRKAENSVQDAIFEYIDPFSSSVSEMVTELIQYQPVQINISREVATFLLAGIILDTNKFTRNVSSRTFEAASYLRKKGALQDYVLQILGTNIDDYIQQSYFLLNSIELPNQGRLLLINEHSSRIEVAKTADFLLSFAEVKYSIVVGNIGESVTSLSARSKGSINVQLIMEAFGGGGHYNNAAAQIDGESVEEVGQRIIAFLNEKEQEKNETSKSE